MSYSIFIKLSHFSHLWFHSHAIITHSNFLCFRCLLQHFSELPALPCGTDFLVLSTSAMFFDCFIVMPSSGINVIIQISALNFMPPVTSFIFCPKHWTWSTLQNSCQYNESILHTILWLLNNQFYSFDGLQFMYFWPSIHLWSFVPVDILLLLFVHISDIQSITPIFSLEYYGLFNVAFQLSTNWISSSLARKAWTLYLPPCDFMF